MSKHAKSEVGLFAPEILRPATVAAFRKLDPRKLVRNPVMFATGLVALVTSLLVAKHWGQPGSWVSLQCGYPGKLAARFLVRERSRVQSSLTAPSPPCQVSRNSPFASSGSVVVTSAVSISAIRWASTLRAAAGQRGRGVSV